MKLLNSNKIKLSIKQQIALTFLALLLLVIGACIVVNSFFLEKYYLKNKQAVLHAAYLMVNESLLDNSYDSDDLSIEIQRICDIYNINMIVMDESTDTLISSMNDSELMQSQLFGNIFGPGIDDVSLPKKVKVLKKTDNYTIQIKSDSKMGNQYIEMWGIIGQGYLFMIRCAVDSITDSVAISNRFLIYIGVAASALSLFIAFWASRKISKPLSDLTAISERMKDLDFEAKYAGAANNEIGILGMNINELSETLERTISELRTANNELAKDLASKIQIDDMRKEFLANVSHELKTPIALVQGYAEGLMDCVNDDEESKNYYCEVILDEAAKMNTLVQKLLTLNQLEFGNDNVVMERFDIVEMVKSYVASADILIKSHDTSVSLEALEPIYVWADAYKAEEVLNNYFTNALNHIDGERRIIIRILENNDNVRVSVFNTGEQIPEEALPFIWDKFYKVDKARTREYGGSGVGLSIVKAIQDSINQDYGVINHSNGVEFYFELAK